MIKLVSLAENTSKDGRCQPKHGLSIYIETDCHRVLFDVGPDKVFLENAVRLGINAAEVDTVVISHGHYDHGGGLADFLKVNQKAKIYIRESAFGAYYTKLLGFYKYIGLDKSLKANPRIVFTQDELIIDDELTIFSGVSERQLYSGANHSLYAKTADGYAHDSFEHEQYLVITDGERQVLITGCSHVGIVNVVKRFELDYKTAVCPTVIGGFHLYDIVSRKYERPDMICQLSRALLQSSGQYYTCHCTGEKAFEGMREQMGERLGYFSAGDEIKV